MRKDIYLMEDEYLSQFATKSCNTIGRDIAIEPCVIRTDFQRDRDRIVHSKSFRRLKHKTQVFLSPEGDHYRTRLTHTLEVSQIARTIANAIKLNEDLVEAISLGHDLGHTPFGHAGEKVLTKLSGFNFEHNNQSLRVVEYLENDGVGLNLTAEVKDGIVNHKISGNPSTLEGKVVSYADRIAYINHDIDDGIRAGILSEEDLPISCTKILGQNKGDRISNLVNNIVTNSYNQPYITLDNEFGEALLELRQFMFDTLYNNNSAKDEEKKAVKLIKFLYQYYFDNISTLPTFYQLIAVNEGKDRAICDYIAGMTDSYAVIKFKEIYVPKGWNLF